MLPAARVALVAACLPVLLHVAPAAAFTPLSSGRPTTEQKRCAAADRRVARHSEGLAALDARLERERGARSVCTKTRQCERLDRQIKSEAARRARIAKQLAQFEDEAKAICAGLR